MSIAVYSSTASEAEYIRKGRYKLYFENDLLNISDGTNIISLDLSHSALINWTPDTTCLYPAFPNGTALTTLNNLLSLIINNIESVNGDLSFKSDLDHKHTATDITDLLTWFNNKKPELKGDNGQDGKDGQDGQDGQDGKDGQDGQDGKSAFELWQLDIYGNIEPKNTTHSDNWQYIDPSGFGDKSNVRLLTYKNEYENRLNLFMKETGKNALKLEDEADEILKTIDYGMTQEEIQEIMNSYNAKLTEITEEMTEEEKQEIREEAAEILASINYGMTQEQITSIQNQYAAKKVEWINWQQQKNYNFSLIYKEVSGYPGDNPTEWELRYYTYRLWSSGEIFVIPNIQGIQSTAERAEETAKTAKKLGIAGTILGAIGTVFGIGNTAAEVMSYTSLQAQIAGLQAEQLASDAADIVTDVAADAIEDSFEEFDEVLNDFHEITGSESIWTKIGNFFKDVWSSISNLNTGYEQVETIMVEGGSLLEEVSATALGVRSITSRDVVVEEEEQLISINDNFNGWYLQQYPSMKGLITAIKTIFESNEYDYSGKDSSLRIVYMMCGELLDRIDLIPDYDERISCLENMIEYKENAHVIEEEEEDVTEFHPEITFKNVETIKRLFNNEIKTVAYVEDVASINHNHDSAYAAINHTHSTFTDITVDTINGCAINPLNSTSLVPVPTIPVIKTDGVMEIGRYLDFHTNYTGSQDYATRLSISDEHLYVQAGKYGRTLTINSTNTDNSFLTIGQESNNKGAQIGYNKTNNYLSMGVYGFYNSYKLSNTENCEITGTITESKLL